MGRREVESCEVESSALDFNACDAALMREHLNFTCDEMQLDDWFSEHQNPASSHKCTGSHLQGGIL